MSLCLLLLDKYVVLDKEDNLPFVKQENIFGMQVEVVSLRGKIVKDVWMDSEGRQFFDFETDSFGDKQVFDVLISHGVEYEPQGGLIIWLDKNTNQTKKYKYDEFVKYIEEMVGKEMVLKTILINNDLWDLSLQGFETRSLNVDRVKELKDDLFSTAHAIRQSNFDNNYRLLYFYDLRID